MQKLIDVELDKIVVEEEIRKTFDEVAISELSSSIERHSVLQPITVEPREDGSYTLLIGGRRLIASRRAGLKTIRALVLDTPLKPNEALEAKLVENLHREDLDPFDEAEAYLTLREMGYSVSAVAKRVGKPRYYVSKRMRLLRLHPMLRETVRRRTLTPGHGHALLRLEDAEQQLALAEEIAREKLSVMDTRRRVREIQGREFEWRLVPLRISKKEFKALQRMASDGDVKRLILETIRGLIQKI